MTVNGGSTARGAPADGDKGDGDKGDAMSKRLELFFGDANDAVARVYARLPNDETSAGLQLSGELIGPQCRFAQTLSARIPFRDRGPGESLLAEAIVPDPCFWTPDAPMLYRARLEARGQTTRAGQRDLSDRDLKSVAIEKWIGIRRLAARGRSLILDHARWVARGVWLDRIGSGDVERARDANAVLAGPAPDDLVCLEASRHGVLLIVELTEQGGALEDELRRLGQWPAVFLAMLPSLAHIDAALRAAAPNMLFAAKFAAGEPIVAPPWAQVLLCEVSAENRFDLGDFPLPIVVRRRSSAAGEIAPAAEIAAAAEVVAERDILTARAACDRLQYDLAPLGDFAGYLV